MDRGVVAEAQYEDGLAIRLANLEGWLMIAGALLNQGWRVSVSVHDDYRHASLRAV